jgi:hypothetical protein
MTNDRIIKIPSTLSGNTFSRHGSLEAVLGRTKLSTKTKTGDG